MVEENIHLLKTRLELLGFDAKVEHIIRGQVCFLPDRFEVCDSRASVNETCMITVYFVKTGNTEIYDCSFYDVCMRKLIGFNDIKIGEVAIKLLDKEMSTINWKEAYSGRISHISAINSETYQFADVSDIIKQLNILSALPEGKPVADRLRFKYWVDTQLESMISNFGQLKAQLEISQRFYFFDLEKPISFDEAIRFLGSRWLEKQVQHQRKQNSHSGLIEHSDKSKNRSTGSGLLAKRHTFKRKSVLKK